MPDAQPPADTFRLSRRQSAALVLLLTLGAVVSLAASRAPAPPATAPWTARVSFMESNRAALLVAPALPESDVAARLRQTAKDPTAPWSAFRGQAAWTPAREAVIARYVDLPNTTPAPSPDGPVDKRRTHTRHFRAWP